MKSKDLHPVAPSQLDLWAFNSIRYVIAGCVLNIRLKEAGICEKYLCDMTDSEVERYTMLCEELRRSMEKKFHP